MSKEFRIEREVVLEATPEAIFAAVTEGTAGWLFPTPALDPADPASGVLVWEPPTHIAVRMDGPDGWFNALEHVIETRDGGTASLRYVHSGVFVDDWDSQYDGASKHTDFYLHSLGEYLAHFAGRQPSYVEARGPETSGKPDSFAVLLNTLGLADMKPGQAIGLDMPGVGHIEALIDYLSPHFLGLRSDDALYRFYGRNHFGGTVDAAHHLFISGVNPEQAADAWGGWLAGVFA